MSHSTVSGRKDRHILWLITFIAISLAVMFLIHPIMGLIILVAFGLYYALDFVGVKPNHILLISRWGKRLWKKDKHGHYIPVFLGEGWGKLLFRGSFETGTEIDLETKDPELPEQIVSTPDQATSKIKLAMSCKPSASNCVQFLNVGGMEKAIQTLLNTIQEKMRSWAFDSYEGPQTWRELKNADDLAMAIIVAEITGKEIYQLHPQITLEILFLKYTHKHPTNQKMRSEWGDGQNMSEPYLGDPWLNLNRRLSLFHEDEISIMEASIKDLIKTTKDLRTGQAGIDATSVGLLIEKLGIVYIQEFGKVAEASLNRDVEAEERESENFELDTDMGKAERLQSKLATKNITKSLDECFHIIMEYKLKREGIKNQSLGSIVGSIVNAMKGGI
jgi:hypothetical protein